MIRPEDIAESVRFLLKTSPYCLVPELVFPRPGEIRGRWARPERLLRGELRLGRCQQVGTSS